MPISPLTAALAALLPAAQASSAAGPAALLDDPGFASLFSGTVRVTRGETVLLAASSGQDRSGAALDQDSAFWIGSISKHFAAVTLLSLVEEGRLSLSDPIASHIAEWDADALGADGIDCTVEWLLSHRCGLPRELGGRLHDVDRDTAAQADLLAALDGVPLDFTPGTAHRYSNVGYQLAGVLAARLTDQPYADALRQRILLPAGLTSTGADPAHAPQLDQRIAPGHFDLPWAFLSSERWLGIPWDAPAGVGAAGSMYSTASELDRWVQALVWGEVLGPRATGELLSPRGEDYALGLVVEEREEGLTVWHNGALSPHGHNSFVGTVPETGITVVVLSNRSRATVSATRIGRRLMEAAHGQPWRSPFPDRPQARAAAGLFGLIFLGLPLMCLPWALVSALRADKAGLVASAPSVATAVWMVLLIQSVLDRFRPSSLAAVLPIGAVALSLLLLLTAWRARALPLVAAEHPRRVWLSAALNVVVAGAVSIAVSALPAFVVVLGITAAAIGLEALRRRR